LGLQSSFRRFEQPAYRNFDLVLGIDEAGRGSIAGPVSVSCVAFPKNFFDPEIYQKQAWLNFVDDSKKLNEKLREELYDYIIQNQIYFSNLLISAKIIDKYNINFAIEKAILTFFRHLLSYKNYKKIKIFIDGNYSFLFKNIKEEIYSVDDYSYKKNKNSIDLEISIKKNQYKISIENIVKGDQKIFSVACASILSKVIRDRYMKRISALYPSYEFEKNKGYGTKKHIQIINQFGYCVFHRRSYNISQQYKLF